MLKRAFTLIELLVVIAIIAILAAILFPVFAQAKESAKKTAALSQTKQSGTGVAIYLADADDTYPLIGAVDDGSVTGTPGAFLFGYVPGVPQGWDGPHFEATDGVVYPNSTHPYMKSYEVLAGPGLQTAQNPVDGGFPPYHAPFKKPAAVNLAANGLLHNYNATAINEPSRVPMLWNGFGKKVNVLGYTGANPVLRCNANTGAPCRFNPDAAPQTGATLPGSQAADAVFYGGVDPFSASSWIWSQGMTFVMSDTSARFYRQNGNNSQYGTIDANYGVTVKNASSRVRSYTDPYTAYAQNGIGLIVNRCSSTGSLPAYSSFFRPDKNDTYTFGSNGRCFN
jgi:prepilin-type N-terminal cleavage/methylation domain-containing protein